MQIDGLPQYKTGDYPYKVYSVKSKDPIRLVQTAANHIKKLAEEGIVLWRVRPQLTRTQDELGNDIPDEYKIYYRVVVVPFNKGVPQIPEKPEGWGIQTLPDWNLYNHEDV